MSDSRTVAMPSANSLGAASNRALDVLSNIQNLMRQPAVVRAAPMIMVSLIVALGLLMIIFLREPAMVTLFPQLGEEDKAQVLQILSDHLSLI